jgi:hypothetical protein
MPLMSDTLAASAAPLARSYWFTQPMMRGDDIFRAQRLLNDRAGAGLKPDGLFGAATRDAVMAFQRRRGLAEDGVLGPVTWAALNGDPRPAGALATGLASVLDSATLAALRTPHTRFPGGIPWRLVPGGIEVDGELAKPSPAEAALAARVLRDRADAIATAAARFPVPVELVVATICTESGGLPAARRLEPGCDPVDPALTPRRVSVGLMQTLLSTAREVLGDEAITLAALENPSLSLRAGMAFMWRQAARTRFDPPLVAAAYNAGSLRFEGSEGNRWKLCQYPIGTGRHVDRFCRFFTGACMALAADPASLPPPGVSFAGLG